MTVPEIGDKAPIFTLPGDGGESCALGDFAGKNVVLFFYPKDDTSGCTKEALAFKESLEKFNAENTVILGISKDSIESHNKYKAKYELPFTLLSDEDTAVNQMYGVWKEKNMYGKIYMGTERSTFLIDTEGCIADAWRKVKVPGHAEAVLEAVCALRETSTHQTG